MGLLLAGGYKKAEMEIQALTEVPVWEKKNTKKNIIKRLVSLIPNSN